MRLKALLVAAIFAICIMGFYAPAQAADGVTPYATVHIWAGYQKTTAPLNPGIGHQDTDFQLGQADTIATNFGIKGEKNGAKVVAEVGVASEYLATPSDSGATYAGGFRFSPRHVYGEYTFAGTVNLLFGQTIAPYSGQNLNDAGNVQIMACDGASYDNWQQQIRLSAFGAYFQIMKPYTSNALGFTTAENQPTGNGSSAANLSNGVQSSNTNNDVLIPKVALGYIFKTDAFSVGVHGVVQKYSVKTPHSTAAGAPTDEYEILAYVGNATFKGNFGPLGVHLHGFYGQNTGDLGFYTHNGNPKGLPTAGNNRAQRSKNAAGTSTYDVEDTKVYGGNAGLSYALGMVKFSGGVGYEKDENDMIGRTTSNTGEGADDFLSYFVNAQISIEQNFSIIPSFKCINYREKITQTTSSKDEGKRYLYGVLFRASI
ncbi:MAG: hypothetical protein V1874_00015 [Spirochaetota bacterium]